MYVLVADASAALGNGSENDKASGSFPIVNVRHDNVRRFPPTTRRRGKGTCKNARSVVRNSIQNKIVLIERSS